MLLDFGNAAMRTAVYEKLPDGSFAGSIRRWPGVVAFAATLYQCREELRSTLEDRLIVKLRHGDRLPVLGGVNLNRDRLGLEVRDAAYPRPDSADVVPGTDFFTWSVWRRWPSISPTSRPPTAAPPT